MEGTLGNLIMKYIVIVCTDSSGAWITNGFLIVLSVCIKLSNSMYCCSEMTVTDSSVSIFT